MKSSIIALAFSLVLGLAADDSAAQCLSYEPAPVTLVGTLTARTLPGPPNYVSVARGDYPETVLILKLDEPICVFGDPSSRLNRETHAGVTEVQIFTPDINSRHFVDKKVRASGTLFGAHMGYHRTPIILYVDKLRAA